jgi:lipid A disaccharide synthetase
MPRRENYPDRYRHCLTSGVAGEALARHEAVSWRDIGKLRVTGVAAVCPGKTCFRQQAGR